MSSILVLDHGFVRLVSYTQPAAEGHLPDENGVRYLRPQQWTGDLEIARATRNQPDAEWRLPDPDNPGAHHDEKLIGDMMRQRHTSPFEFMDFTFHVKAPIFVFRQWHRHRTQSYQEISARYTKLPEEFYVPDPSKIGYQDKKNRQGRTSDQHENAGHIAHVIRNVSAHAHREYRDLLGLGMPRELARAILPVNTYSMMYAKANLHNWFHFLGLRIDPHAQYEIRVYAEAILTLIRSVVPVTVEAWEKSRARG